MKYECQNCKGKYSLNHMVNTPYDEWVCETCIAEDPEFYGFEFDTDDES